MDDYITRRLKELGADEGSDITEKYKALEAENAQLKQQLEQAPPINFKSEAQVAFEQSPEFEATLNAFYMRWLRDKFGAEFRSSPHIAEFQKVANSAFSEFEKKYSKKEVPKNATQASKKSGSASGNGNAAVEQHDG